MWKFKFNIFWTASVYFCTFISKLKVIFEQLYRIWHRHHRGSLIRHCLHWFIFSRKVLKISSSPSFNKCERLTELSISFNKTCSWELVSVTSSVFPFQLDTVYVDVVFNTLLVEFVFLFKVSDIRLLVSSLVCPLYVLSEFSDLWPVTDIIIMSARKFSSIQYVDSGSS